MSRSNLPPVAIASRARARLLLVLLGCALVAPGAAGAECYERTSRLPMSSAAAPAPLGYRASMLRGGPGAVATPAKGARAGVAKAARKAKAPRRTAAVHRAKSPRKAVAVHKAAHRPALARKASPKVRRAAAAPVRVAGPAVALPRPTSPLAAARDIARVREFALIKTTICTSGPGPGALLGAPPEATPDTFGIVIPPAPPGGGGTDEPGGWPPGPPLTPVEDGPYIVGPPDGPPGPPGPPTEPPPDIPSAVPEPGTWLLLIAGFAAVGARLRTRRRIAA